ncbi:hypothetical protein NDU88_002998 [Pleurodeles waltl]|uniref:Uncharacterized protein n=1 Tax=Pleurodeles waltl TaxID=8319 RepID=A0AAV7Q8E1_PLEWA|nr:hypothetical protein NDU88_002998 [Pleurodeles waltl]
MSQFVKCKKYKNNSNAEVEVEEVEQCGYSWLSEYEDLDGKDEWDGMRKADVDSAEDESGDVGKETVSSARLRAGTGKRLVRERALSVQS